MGGPSGCLACTVCSTVQRCGLICGGVVRQIDKQKVSNHLLIVDLCAQVLEHAGIAEAVAAATPGIGRVMS